MDQSDYYRGVEAAQVALRNAVGVPAEERAAAVHAALDTTLAASPMAPHRACRLGCAHCCHLPVGVTFGEARQLVLAVRTLPHLAARVREEAIATRDMPWLGLAGRPCPLLDRDACTLHAMRPLPCRALASSDAAACARGVLGRGDVPIDEPSFYGGLGAAMTLAGAELPGGSRELRSALGALLDAADAEHAAAFRAARAVGDPPA